MFSRVRSGLTFSNIVSMIALFVVLGSSAYAVTRVGSRQIINNSVRSKDIRNGQVLSRDIRDKTVANSDINAGVALAKGFASVEPANANGPATVSNFGGQQTTAVSARRAGRGAYDVTFTGEFTNVDNVNDLTWQVTARDGSSTGSVLATGYSTASATSITLRVFMRSGGGATHDSGFSVQFYTGTTP